MRIDGSIYEKYLASYGVFCPLMNLTKFNRHVNIAYTSAYAAPDLYSSSVYVACAHIKTIKGMILALSIYLAMWWRAYWGCMYRSITFNTISNNHKLNTTPTND